MTQQPRGKRSCVPLSVSSSLVALLHCIGTVHGTRNAAFMQPFAVSRDELPFRVSIFHTLYGMFCLDTLQAAVPEAVHVWLKMLHADKDTLIEQNSALEQQLQDQEEIKQQMAAVGKPVHSPASQSSIQCSVPAPVMSMQSATC